jgi:hypothetical protein
MQLRIQNRASSLLLSLFVPCFCAVTALGQVPGERLSSAPSVTVVQGGLLASPIDFGDSDRIPEFVYRRTAEFMAINENTVEFADKVPFAVQPIYAHGVDGIAYFEVWLTRNGMRTEGWLLLSAVDADYPLVNFSHEGTPYSQQVIARANELGEPVLPDDRIFRFGVSYFALESPDGRLLADFGEMPTWLPKDEDLSGSGQGDSANGLPISRVDELPAVAEEHVLPILDYQDLVTQFPRSYFTPKRAELAADMRRRIFPDEGHGEAYNNSPTAGYIYRYIYNYSNQALYTQIPGGYRYNYTGCWSGCTNNAWTSLYGWWDKNMGKSNFIMTTSGGETCPTYRNTTAREDVVDPVQMVLNALSGTYCNNGAGTTYFWNVANGISLIWQRGYGYSYWFQWCLTGGCHVNIASIVIDCIGNNARPAHVSTSVHSWVGTGLCQWDTNTDWTWVYAYPGWGEDHSKDVWIWWRDLYTATRVYVY